MAFVEEIVDDPISPVGVQSAEALEATNGVDITESIDGGSTIMNGGGDQADGHQADEAVVENPVKADDTCLVEMDAEDVSPALMVDVANTDTEMESGADDINVAGERHEPEVEEDAAKPEQNPETELEHGLDRPDQTQDADVIAALNCAILTVPKAVDDDREVAVEVGVAAVVEIDVEEGGHDGHDGVGVGADQGADLPIPKEERGNSVEEPIVIDEEEEEEGEEEKVQEEEEQDEIKSAYEIKSDSDDDYEEPEDGSDHDVDGRVARNREGRKRVSPRKQEPIADNDGDEEVVITDFKPGEPSPEVIVIDDSSDYEPDSDKKPKREAKANGVEYENTVLRPLFFAEKKVKADTHWVYLFFRFCVERHKMYERREAGVPRDQLTTDETMRSRHIGNVFRELDPGSIMMKDIIINNGEQSRDEVCFRVFLYTAFYNRNTWSILCDAATGDVPTWKHFEHDMPAMEAALGKAVAEGTGLYQGGFQQVPPTIYFDPLNDRNRQKSIANYAASLRLVLAMMQAGLPEKLSECKYAVDASNVLQTFPTLGGFLSLNILCYLNDTVFTWLYREFATCGPGSRYYLQRIFGERVINSTTMEDAGMKWLADHQWRYYARLGLDPPHEWRNGLRPGMRVLDIENALCWVHRYVSAYEKNGTGSLADLPNPEFDPELTEHCSEPAWCPEEKYAANSSQPFWQDAAEFARLAELEEDVYEVEKVIGRHKKAFRVRWTGWPPEEDTYESEKTLKEGSREALEEWTKWENRVWDTIERIRTTMKPKPKEKSQETVRDSPTRSRSKSGKRTHEPSTSPEQPYKRVRTTRAAVARD